MKKILYILFLVLIISGCNREDTLAREAFEESSAEEICLEMNGGRVFTYEENTCQASFIEASREYRIGKDDMSDFYIIKCSSTPVAGESLTADLIWTTASDIRERKNLSFRVLKIDDKDGRIWFWCQSLRAGVVVMKP